MKWGGTLYRFHFFFLNSFVLLEVTERDRQPPLLPSETEQGDSTPPHLLHQVAQSSQGQCNGTGEGRVGWDEGAVAAAERVALPVNSVSSMLANLTNYTLP